MRLSSITKQEVIDYLEAHKVKVFLSYEEEQNGEKFEFWGCSIESGFTTFDGPMDEEKAKYAACIFHQMVNNDMDINDAEKMANAYVATYKVMQPPLTEEEQETVRKRLFACIESGNLNIPDGVQEAIDAGRVSIRPIDDEYDENNEEN